VITERYEAIKSKVKQFYDELEMADDQFQDKSILIKSGTQRKKNRTAFEMVAQIARNKESLIKNVEPEVSILSE
jgi:hypothetical protein